MTAPGALLLLAVAAPFACALLLLAPSANAAEQGLPQLDFANRLTFLQVFWLAVISRVNLSIAYPLLAIGYVLTTVWALVFLKEPVPTSRWLGIGAIIVGIVLVLYRS